MSAYPAWRRLRRISGSWRYAVGRTGRYAVRPLRITLMTGVVGRAAPLIISISWHFHLISVDLYLATTCTSGRSIPAKDM